MKIVTSRSLVLCLYVDDERNMGKGKAESVVKAEDVLLEGFTGWHLGVLPGTGRTYPRRVSFQ